MLRSLTLTIALLTTAAAIAQSSSERAAVRVTATVQNTPSITLSWAPIASTTSLTIYRKAKSATSWGSAVATPASTATSWTDASVSLGVNYEYKIVRVSAGVTGTGYINTGVQVPVVDYRGKIILLVDNTLSASLSAELTVLTNDLRADGWGVIRSDVSRTASVASIKSIIQGHYNNDPANVKALYIIGHVPVPYSGNITPDGHEDTRGARPTDAYYADMDGVWTDNSVNNTMTTQQRTWNTPGDGKFDQSDLPSSVELQVGRVDMYDMPAFGTTEVQLLRNYLNKAHNYKVKGWTPEQRAVLVDNLQWLGNPVAGSGWRASALVGQISPVPPAPVLSFKNYINGQSYLWTAHYGGGLIATDGGVTTYNGTDGGITTQELASSVTMGGVFNMALGSFFYDFDSRNNFLRAVIARGDGLTNCWAGIPAWYFHHMGLGENIGYSVAASMNNTGLYAPLTEGWQSSIGRTHMNLMGDPTLRMKMVSPPSNLTVTNSNGNASFAWTASTEASAGYHIFQVDATTNVTTRLTTTPVTTTTWTSGTVPFVAGRQYMVRAVKLEVGASGSYYNQSLGALAVSSGTGSADCLGVIGGSATVGTPCNDNNACTTNDVYNASCQCIGTPITPAATISAAGATTFCTGGSVVLNANTGAGYSYAWQRNGTVITGATSSSYTATQAGTYTVTVTYSGCSSTSANTTVTVTSAPTATIAAGGSTSFCNGGSVVLNANTGTGFTYVWRRNGTAISGATSSSYTATLAGTYTVVVSIGSCSATSSSTTVTVAGGTAPVATAQGSTSFCNGGSVVLSTTTATGNTYQWRLNGGTINGATSSSYTATQTGSYSVTVNNGTCTATSNAISVSASGSLATPVITANGPTSFCSGGNVILTTQQASGNTYQWYVDGEAMAGATSYAYTAFWNGATTVRVTNGGCSATSAPVNIAVGSQPSATISAGGPTTFCNGGSVVLSGNTGTGYTYSWARNGTTISGATASSYTATQAGSYTRTVNNNGCTATSSAVTVSVAAGSAPTLTAQGATSFCSGGSVVLSTATATGNSYVWRRNGTIISGATSSTYTATLAGSYTVSVTNGSCSGTSNTISVTVSTSSTPTLTAQGSTSFCTGGSVVLSTATATGNSYVWRRNGTTISGATSSTYTATLAGSYTVSVTNGSCSGTSNTISVSVSTSSTPTLTAQGSTSFCSGGSVVLSTASATGNSYVWRRNGSTISGATSSTYAATLAGSYTVSVTNGACSGTSNAVTVTVSGSGTTPVITALGATSFCSGANVILTTQQASGNTYQWRYNGVVISGATSYAYTAYLNGAFTVTVSNGTCTATSAPMNITVGSAPQATITASSPTSFCAGGSVTLNANTGTGLSYAWFRNGSAISGATGSNYVATLTGAYTVQVTNNGCSRTSGTVNVVANGAPTVSCSNNAGAGTVSVTVSGGLAPYSYSWNTSPASTSSTATVYNSGTYTVVVTDARGCTATCSTTITVNSVDECTGIRTETQSTWGATPGGGNMGFYMVNNFASAFTAPNYLTIGCGSRFLRFTNGYAVANFLPSNGSVSQLPSGTMVNPTNYSNSFAAELVALKLNVRFDEFYTNFSPSYILLKDMVVASGLFAGWTVQQVIDAADQKIGNCGNSYTREALNAALVAINQGYAGGTTNSGYLVCPSSGFAPEPVEEFTAVMAKSIEMEPMSVDVFPNPTNGLTTFFFTPTSEEGQTTLLEIRALNGALVQSRQLGVLPAGEPQRVEWDATDSRAGLYLYRIITGSQTVNGKLVVE
ncbi:MAG: T9SS type A sorting domain-containing protein [Flavobacteriales bacterium]|nr:T9SS type A sorting domain-containing protein [Flavobacteriales bacterium]